MFRGRHSSKSIALPSTRTPKLTYHSPGPSPYNRRLACERLEDRNLLSVVAPQLPEMQPTDDARYSTIGICGDGAASTQFGSFLALSGLLAASVTTPSSPQSGNVTISYVLFDSEMSVCNIQVQYSTDGGTNWHTAMQGPGGHGTIALFTSPDGISHTFVWASRSDLGDTFASNVMISIYPSKGSVGGIGDTTNAFTLNNVPLRMRPVSGDSYTNPVKNWCWMRCQTRTRLDWMRD